MHGFVFYITEAVFYRHFCSAQCRSAFAVDSQFQVTMQTKCVVLTGLIVLLLVITHQHRFVLTQGK